MMQFLSREDILSAQDLKREHVPVPEWGGCVVIGMLSLGDRLEYERWVLKQPEDSNEISVRFVALTLLDEATGARLFSEDDVKLLLEKSPEVVLRLGRIATRLNRLGDPEVAQAKGESGPSRS